MSCYSRKLDDALALAADAFRSKVRKHTAVPYLTHLLQVMVTVGEHGGDEEQMIAAVLHDYLEDIEGASYGEIQLRFGPRVARLVLALSDSTTQPKPLWKERKVAYIARLRDEDADLKLISAADKLHNASCIARDFEVLGDEVWERFTASRDETLWYYRAVTDALADGWDHPLVRDLRRVVEGIHASVGVPYGPV